MSERIAVMLINLGTPVSTRRKAVYAFLSEFLMDPYVIQVSWFLRFCLVYGFILPFRVRSSQKAYKMIWRSLDNVNPLGSPLLYHSQALTTQLLNYLNQHYPNRYQVQLALRYSGNSLSIKNVVRSIKKNNIQKIIVLPLYPQYAESTTESSIQAVLKEAKKNDLDLKQIKIIRDFYEHPGFINPLASLIQRFLQNKKSDYLLFSFHGLPQQHVQKMGCYDCAALEPCPKISSTTRSCYRAQCFASVRAVVKILGLKPGTYGVSFQSRLGRVPWIGPYTDEYIKELAQKGVRHLAVVSPSFITDCLETKEEIELRLQKSWFELVGQPQNAASFYFIPCLNDHPEWVAGIEQIIHNKNKKMDPLD